VESWNQCAGNLKRKKNERAVKNLSRVCGNKEAMAKDEGKMRQSLVEEIEKRFSVSMLCNNNTH
jgi:hypothetical protein